MCCDLLRSLCAIGKVSITLSILLFPLNKPCFKKQDLVKRLKTDYIIWLIALSEITLRCTNKFSNSFSNICTFLQTVKVQKKRIIFFNFCFDSFPHWAVSNKSSFAAIKLGQHSEKLHNRTEKVISKNEI